MKYRKKPVVVEAFKYVGSLFGSDGEYNIPGWAIEAYRKGIIRMGIMQNGETPCSLFIDNRSGKQHIPVGDYIIRGTKGEIYGCSRNVFADIYEECEEK